MSRPPKVRVIAALLSALIVFEAGAVAPAFVMATEPSQSPPPTEQPDPTSQPSPDLEPTPEPTVEPTVEPTQEPTPEPTVEPTVEPTQEPTPEPTVEPTSSPSPEPTSTPAADEPVELTDMRTADSQTFRHPDGTLVTDFYASPIFYQPEGSTEWQPIDLRFMPVTGGPVNLRADKNRVSVALSAADNVDGFLSLAGGGHTINFRLPAGILPGQPNAQAAIREDGLFAEYDDFLPGGIGLRVFPQVAGVKSFLVLPGNPAIRPFSFIVDAPGLTLTKDDDGSVAFHDATGALVARMPQPYMVDSSSNPEFGSGRYSADVTLDVTTVGPLTVVSIYPDQAFLDAAVYPVYIDPSVVFGGPSVGDTFVTAHWPATNFNTYQRPDSPYYHEMWLGREPGTGWDAEVFLRFDIAATFYANARIDSASLIVYPYHQYNTQSATWIDFVGSSWSPSTLTWSNRPSSHTTIGMFPTTTGSPAGVDVTARIQDVASGATDNGFRLHEDGSGQENWKRLVASEDGSGLGPFLAVTWHRPEAVPVATPSGWNNRKLAWTYDSPDASQSHYWVQVASACGGTPLRETSGPWVASSATTWTFPSSGSAMTEGTTYNWRVKVKDGLAESDWSSCQSFKYDNMAPPAPAVSDETASNPYAYRTGNTIYFNPNQSGSFTLTGSAADPGETATPPTGSGTDHYDWLALSGTPTGWSASATTRLYLLNTTPNISPGYSSSWENTGYGSRKDMALTPALSGHLSTMTGTGTAADDVLSRQFVGPPMAAQVICGTIKGQVIARQVNGATGARPQLLARVLNSTGGNSRTIKSMVTGTSTADEFYVAGSTFENRMYPRGGEAPLSYNGSNCLTVNDGDRLVVEVGFRNNGTDSTSEVRLRYSAAANTGNLDLPEDQTSRYSNGSDHPYAWIEFSSVLLSADTSAASVGIDGNRSFGWASGAASTSATVKATDGAGNQGNGTTITLTRDPNNPARSFSTPLSGGPEFVTSGSYVVTYTTSDGLSGIASWSLQRQIATTDSGTCGTFADDGAAGNLVTGTAAVTNATNSQTLAQGSCYRWRLTATDHVGNVSSTLTSGTVLRDNTAPLSGFTISNNAASVASAYAASPTATTIWFRPSGAGTITLTSNASDPESGIASHSWTPASQTGWTLQPSSGPSRTYTYGSSAGQLDASVSAVNKTDLARVGPTVTFVPDEVVNTVSFSSPAATTYTPNTPYVVTFTVGDAGSGVASWWLQRQIATASGGSCGSFANDTASGNLVTGSSAVTNSTSSQALAADKCYQWVLTGTDRVGNVLSLTSSRVIRDPNAPGVTFTAPVTGSTTYVNTTSKQVSWTETSGASGVATRSLQRQRVALTNGAPGTSWANDGSASTALSPITVTGLLSGYCYRWVQTLTSGAGISASSTSGVVCVDTGVPNGATIGFPEQGRALAGTVAITGTASDALTASTYDLEYGVGSAPATWTTIALNQPGPISGGSLATWATQALQGVYTLRLTVRDAAGNSATATRTVYLENSRRGDDSYRTRVPFDLGGGWRMAVGVANGELTLERGLFEVPSYGPPQSLALSYSSKNASTASQFGTGWSSNLTQFLTFEDGFVVWHHADGGLLPFGQIAGTWTPLAGHFETLAYDSGVNRYTVTQRDQTKLVFEGTGAGRLVRIENRFGKALTLAWDTSSATATDASGRATTLTISGGKVTAATDSAGGSWSFAYSGDNLTSVTDPAGASTTLAYGSSGPTTITRSRSRVGGAPETITWSVTYASGMVSGVKDPIDSSVANTFTYATDSATVGLLKTYSPLVRNTWTYNYDHLGRVTSALDPAGYTSSYAFDAASNLTQMVLPIEVGPPAVGQTISYTYDGRGNVLTETTQLTATQNVITAMSYNATNDLLTRSEADDDAAVKTVTLYAYDAAGQLISANVNCTSSGTTPPTNAATCTGAGTQNASTNLITTYTNTANDQLETETDPLGRVTKHVYDAYGNEIETIANYVAGASATAERNVSATTSYNAAGLPTSISDPVGVTITYTYDVVGRQTSEALPGDESIPALTQTTTYDEFGNVLSEIEAWTSVERTTTYVYDKANRQTRATDPAGVESTTAYDAAGDAISTTSGGVTTTSEYDGLGRVLSETSAGATTTRAYDGQGRELTTVDAGDTVTTQTYDRAGRLLEEKVASADGNLITTYAHDLLGRQISSRSADDITTSSSYDRSGRLTASTVADATTSYGYDRAGNQIETTDPTGVATTTQYDALNRATVVVANAVENPSQPTDNLTTTTFYDAAGRTVAVRDATGISTRSIYNVRGLVKKSIANCADSGTTPTADPPNCTGAGTHNAKTNVVSTTSYDGSGAAVLVIVAEGTGAETSAEFAYDAAGRRQASRDPRGTVSRTFYDDDGRVTRTIVNCTDDVVDPAPPSASWWNCAGSGLEDGTWNVTTAQTYNSAGNTATETAPNGRITKYIYDDAYRLVERIDNYVAGSPSAADQNISTFYAYDDAGRQSAVRAPTTDRATFSVTRYVYDNAGHLASEIHNCTDVGTTPLGDPAWKSCSGDGSQDASTNLVTSYGYDDRGNQVSVTQPDPSADSGSSTDTVTTRYAYDASGRLCGVLENATVGLASPDPCATDVAGGTDENVWTVYAYDGGGNLASMTNGEDHTTLYGHDERGAMTSLTDGDGNTTTWTYDELGRRVSQSVRGGTDILVSWTYDAAGQMTGRTADGATTSYAYDEAGNRTSSASAAGTISVAYDRLNRPLTVSDSADAGATTSYSYSLDSPAWTDPSGTYSANLDAFDRQVGLTDPIHAEPWTFAYRADGQPSSVGAPNSTLTDFDYDAAGNLAAKTTIRTSDSATIAAYSWMRNRAGNIFSESSDIDGDPTNGTTTYTYDLLGRLTGYERGGSTTAYAWQAVPNRRLVQVDSDPAVTTTYDQANRPTSDSAGGAYASDAEGRLVARPGQSLEWDDLGRLVAVRDAPTNGLIAAYTYDALDRLLVLDHGGADRIRFRYVGLTTQVAQIVDDADDSVLLSVANDWTGSRLFDWSSSAERFYGTNAHHDVTWTANNAGYVTSTARYDPWGTLVSSTGSHPDFGFQSSWIDSSTDLYWVVARWYAPALGRFISEDGLLGEPPAPQSRQLYAYGAGNPINAVDPNGNEWASVQSGNTLELLAGWYLGNRRYWPSLYNANRNNPKVKGPNNIQEGACIYIPYGEPGWKIPKPWPGAFDNHDRDCAKWSKKPKLITISDLRPATGQQLGQAALTLGVFGGWYNLDWSTLADKTDFWTGRERIATRKTMERWERHVGSWNKEAAAYFRRGGGVRRDFVGTGLYLVYDNTILPDDFSSDALAVTWGTYVFLNLQVYDPKKKPAPVWLKSHEYIHILQFQGFSDYLDRYSSYSVGKGFGGDARNPYEAVAYLWGGWIDSYAGSRVDDKRNRVKPPWEYWQPPHYVSGQ